MVYSGRPTAVISRIAKESVFIKSSLSWDPKGYMSVCGNTYFKTFATALHTIERKFSKMVKLKVVVQLQLYQTMHFVEGFRKINCFLPLKAYSFLAYDIMCLPQFPTCDASSGLAKNQREFLR